jgi:penicillin-binding protein 2
MILRKAAKPIDEHLSKMTDPLLEKRLFSRRAFLSLAGVLGGLLTVAGKLAYLQVLNHRHFTTLSENNRVKLQPLAPTRGLIFDRNGVLLAENLISHRLEITPELVQDMEATLEQLRERIELSDTEVERFRKLRGRNPIYNSIPLRFRLSEEEIARVAIDLYRFPGVEIKADLNRHYPLGSRAAHVIGYVGRIDEAELQKIDERTYQGTTHIGKTGVEKSYEEILRGQTGYQQVETNAEGRILRVLERKLPVAGQNIYLTIDIRLQVVAEQALQGYNGAVVAIDPRNGDILALASMPVFDPNPFVNGIDVASYRALNISPDRPLLNRALKGLYPPGSTIKPFMALAGLEFGTTNRNRAVFCPGSYSLSGSDHRFRCWKKGGHGTTNLDKAITQSCDVFFYDLALNTGVDHIHDFLDKFCLGRHTGVDLPGERPGVLPSQAWKRRTYNRPWYAGETLNIGIGQGYMLTTPLQLAHATAILAQGGKSFQPRILCATQEQGSQEKHLAPPRPLPPVETRDPRQWEFVTTAMAHVVQFGTARKIGQGSSYSIAGKTGTAQVFSLGRDEKYDVKRLAKHLQDHALFVAFAPTDNPRIAVAVIAEHGGGGSATAAPIAKQVLDAYLLT